MIYRVSEVDALLIENDFGKYIFLMNKYNNWSKSDFDHEGKPLYYEDDTGHINNYQ